MTLWLYRLLALLVSFIVAVALLNGPLRSYVPPCSAVSFGFCFGH